MAKSASSTAAPIAKEYRFDQYDGAKQTRSYPLQAAWVMVPFGSDGNFARTRITLSSLRRVEGDMAVVAYGGSKELFVPAALATPAVATDKTAKGDAVFAYDGLSGYAARVVSPKPDAIKLRYLPGSEPADMLPQASQMLPLTDSLTFGQPVVYKEGDE